MITDEGSGTRITYHFWHPLFVSYLYDGLSAGRRASLHRRAAEVLRHMYQGREEEGAAAIAYHLVHGGADAAQIAHFAEMAGDRAYALSAYPEAVQHYTLALSISEHCMPVRAQKNTCTWPPYWNGLVNVPGFRETILRHVAFLSKLWKNITSIVSRLQTLILNTKRKSKPCSGVKLGKPGTTQVITNMLSNVIYRGEQVLT